jgi:hypothetical protein
LGKGVARGGRMGYTGGDRTGQMDEPRYCLDMS